MVWGQATLPSNQAFSGGRGEDVTLGIATVAMHIHLWMCLAWVHSCFDAGQWPASVGVPFHSFSCSCMTLCSHSLVIPLSGVQCKNEVKGTPVFSLAMTAFSLCLGCLQ